MDQKTLYVIAISTHV